MVAAVVARDRPGARVLASDESAAAVAVGPGHRRGRTASTSTVVRDLGLSQQPDGSADLVLLNPPFHSGATVHPGVARPLFAEAARVLRPGGELWTVYNSHLEHKAVLQRLVGPHRAGRPRPLVHGDALRRRLRRTRTPETHETPGARGPGRLDRGGWGI